MSLIWTISGTGRKVGKTTLAQSLLKVLPNSVYAKSGHAKPSASKPDNFFTDLQQLKDFIENAKNSFDHIIVESNAIAKTDLPDITVFIDTVAAKSNFRNDCDRLKDCADIMIAKDTELCTCKEMLSEKIGSQELADAALLCFADQKKYLFAQTLKVCSKIWFQVGNQRIFGRGLSKLLANIERTGTLQQAAIDSGMSYRYAWKLIQTAQERLGKTLVNKHPGGKAGGASALSPAARNILDVFNRLNEMVADFADKNFQTLYEDNK